MNRIDSTASRAANSAGAFFKAPALILLWFCCLAYQPIAYGAVDDPYFGVGHMAGDDVGVDDGYSTFNAFFPLATGDAWTVFSDSQFLLFNEQSDALGGSVGIGARTCDSTYDRIFGGYGYYDIRNTGSHKYDQLGFGFETLGPTFDGRVNFNFPTEMSRNIVSFTPDAPTFGGPTGQNIVVGAGLFERPLQVIDFEGGALLAGGDYWQLRSFAGAYNLYADEVNEWGARGRLELRSGNRFSVSGHLANDRLLGTTAGINCQWRFGGGRTTRSDYSVCSRLGDPVVRRRYVAVAEARGEVFATRGGVPISVLHIDSNAAAGGMGGVNDPIDNLIDASNQPFDIVFAHADSVFAGQSLEISSENQALLGEGVPHLIATDRGPLLLPTANPPGATPIITASALNGVAVFADGVTISGMEITSSTLSGVSFDGTGGDYRVDRSTISGNGLAGIRLNSVGGRGVIADNTIDSNSVSGISADDDFTGEITGNQVRQNTLAGIVVVGDVNGRIAGNTVTDTLAAGPDTGVGIGVGGDVVAAPGTAALSNNIVRNNGFLGIAVDGNVTGDIHNNVAELNTATNLQVRGVVNGSVTDNTASSSTIGNGMFLAGGVTGDIAGNTASGNDRNNIQVGTDITPAGVGGSVTNNTTSNGGATATGILVTGAVNGDVSQNVADANGSSGISVPVVIGDIDGNRANLNGNNGISTGAVVGDVKNNTTNENGAFGLVGVEIGGSVAENTANENVTGLAFEFIDGDLRDNTANANSLSGFFITGNVLGDVAINTATGNMSEGLVIFGSVGGDVQLNTTNTNAINGMTLGGVDGSLNGNTASNNGSNGIRIANSVAQDMLGNTTSGNATDGINVQLNVGGDIQGNTANNNGDDGIDVGGTIGGATAPNTFIGNGGLGLRN